MMFTRRSRKATMGVVGGVLVVLLVCSLALAGTIEFWTHQDDMQRDKHRSWNWIFNEYERMTGEKINVTYVPYDQLFEKLMAAFAGGKEPDVLAIYQSLVPTFLKNDLLQPFPEDVEKEWDDVLIPLAQQLKIDGKVYSLPLRGDIYQLTYNKDMFEEAGLDPNRPPETWKEFREYAKRLVKREGGKITRVGYAFRYVGAPLGVIDKILWAIWSAGARIIDPPDQLTGGKAAFNNEAGKAAVSLYIKMLYEDKSTAFGFPDPRDAFMQRKAAMQISTGGAIASRILREAPNMRVGYALPPYPEGGIKVTNFNVDPTICVASTSDKKKLGFKFIKYLMRPEISLYAALTANIHQLGFGVLSLSKVVQEHQFFSDNPYYREISETSKYARAYPINVNVSEAYMIFGAYMVKAWHKEMSVDEILAKAEKEVNAVLKE